MPRARKVGVTKRPVARTRKLPCSVVTVLVTFLGCVTVCATSGCGSSGAATPPAGYRPPLHMSPRSLAFTPGSSRLARKTLRTIATGLRAAPVLHDSAVHFEYVQFRMIVVNLGSPETYALRQTLADEVTVMPDSSAVIREQVLSSPRFISRADRRAWQATGQRPYTSPSNHAGASFSAERPAGSWSFTPQGVSLTFAGVRHLPTTRPALDGELARLLGARGDTVPPAALSLRQYGFLLAAAPLSGSVRVALLESIVDLPGIHVCGNLFPSRRPHFDAFCINGDRRDPVGTGILVNPRTGVVGLVCERLYYPTPLYVRVRVGTLLDSDTFSARVPA